MWQPARAGAGCAAGDAAADRAGGVAGRLVEFSALASAALSVALQMHPQLQWMLPLLPLAGPGLAALQLVLLMLAVRLATSLWPGWEMRWGAPGPDRGGGPVAGGDAGAVAAVGHSAGAPGPATLLVMAALCLAVLRRRNDRGRAQPRSRAMMPMLAPLAAALCLRRGTPADGRADGSLGPRNTDAPPKATLAGGFFVAGRATTQCVVVAGLPASWVSRRLTSCSSATSSAPSDWLSSRRFCRKV
jgi:hypothetical protein